MKKYRKRIADSIITRKLEGKGAVLVEGAKWCGKTTTAEQLAKSIIYMSDPEKCRQYMDMADINPKILLQGIAPSFRQLHLLLIPPLRWLDWDYLHHYE